MKYDYSTIEGFNFWCQKILPLVYDESLSYYEVLCKVQSKLNEVINSQNNLQNEFYQLKEWIDTQLETYTKEQLQEWLDDGTLENMILQLGHITRVYDTTEELKNAKNLVENMYIQTLGYYSINDGGSGLFKVTETPINEVYNFQVENLYCNLISKIPNVNQMGAYGNGINDDSDIINNAFKIYDVVKLLPKTYKINKTINIHQYQQLIGNNAIIQCDNNFEITSYNDKPNYICFWIIGLEHNNFNFYKQKTMITDINIQFTGNNDMIDIDNVGLYIGCRINKPTAGTTSSYSLYQGLLKNVNINNFKIGMFLSECWETTFEDIVISNCENKCLNLSGQSVNNMFSNLYIYGLKQNSIGIVSDRSNYTNIRNEGNNFNNCFIGQCKQAIYIYTGYLFTFNNCIIDLNENECFYGTDCIDIYFNNCYFSSRSGNAITLANMNTPKNNQCIFIDNSTITGNCDFSIQSGWYSHLTVTNSRLHKPVNLLTLGIVKMSNIQYYGTEDLFHSLASNMMIDNIWDCVNNKEIYISSREPLISIDDFYTQNRQFKSLFNIEQITSGYISDFNNFLTSGIYFVNTSPANAPSGYSGYGTAIIFTSVTQENAVNSQTILLINNNHIYFRLKTGGNWQDWVTLL